MVETKEVYFDDRPPETFLLARVSLHHRLVKYSNIRGQIADSTRQTYGHGWFDKSTIRHRIFEYSDSTESKCPSLVYRVLGVTGVVTGFMGSFITGIVGASIDAIEVVGVLSRGHGPAETPKSTGGPSLGNWSWRGIRVQDVLVWDI